MIRIVGCAKCDTLFRCLFYGPFHCVVGDNLTRTIVSVDVQIGAAFTHRAKVCDRIDFALLNLTNITHNTEGAVGVNATEVGLSLYPCRGVRILHRYTCALEQL